MAAVPPVNDGRSPPDPSSNAGPTNTQLASLLSDAYREMDDLRERARQEKDRADYWQKIAETSGDRQIQSLHKEIYETKCQRDVERARRVALTDQWRQLRDYLTMLDTQSQQARIGLDRLFNLKGAVAKELDLQPLPLIQDINAGPRTWRDVSQKKRKRDASPSPSIDEMILEAADEAQGGPSEPFPQPPSGGPLTSTPTMSVSLSPTTSTRPTTGSFQTHIFAPVVTGAPTKRAKYSSSGQITAQMSHHTNGLSGGRSDSNVDPSTPARIWPATNAAGQRICRSCGEPGRYKEDKCIEKWGPGPMGPGTVCDRCRKKMKRVERRSTMNGAPVPQLAGNNMPQAATHVANIAPPLMGRMTLPLVKQPTQLSPKHASGNDLAPSKADTLVLPPPSLPPPARVIQSSPGSGSDADGDADDDDTVNEEASPPAPVATVTDKDAPAAQLTATTNGHVSNSSNDSQT